MEVRLRPLALDDLGSIIDYIAQENPSAALRIVDEIEAFCMLTLADNPHIAPTRDGIHPGLRIFTLNGYRVCYIVRETYVDVVRVLHHARDLPRILRKLS